jgi:putative hydrolase of the HAD superfamily
MRDFKAILFDFGGVLVRTADQTLRRAWEQRLGLHAGQAEEIVFRGEHGRAAQLGQITAATHWRWIGERLRLDAATLAQFRCDFFARDVLDRELLADVDRLRRAGYHLGLVSNAGDDARQRFREDYGINDHFDALTISAEEGVMKPDRRLYEIALARADVAPAQTVFVDDFFENVEAARAIGMYAIHFQHPIDARRELAALTGA